MRHYRLTSLVVICAQTTALVLLTRYSRVHVPGPAYLASTAIFLSELCKLAISVAMLLLEFDVQWRAVSDAVTSELRHKPGQCLLLAVPSLLYTLQNNIIFFALAHLSAATFQVTYQLKILVTAVLSRLMLRKQLTVQQWLSLVVLVLGVVLVQFNPDRWQGSSSASDDSLLGFGSVLLACLSSGFSGVYFEKIVKADKERSLAMRNLQLSLFSVPLSLAAVVLNDAALVAELGFFHGYNFITIIIILLHAVGGIAVSVAVKYADNVLKGFATSISIVLSTALSCLVERSAPTTLFVAGSAMVVVSSLLYGRSSASPSSSSWSRPSVTSSYTK